MFLSICKEVLPYYPNLSTTSEAPRAMTKEELACWLYLIARSTVLGGGVITLKGLAEAFGYSSASARNPKILSSLRAALVGMAKKAQRATSAEFEVDADEVKNATPTHEIQYRVAGYQEVRTAPFICIQGAEIEKLLQICRRTSLKLPELLNVYTAILGNLVTLKNGVGRWLWSNYLTGICGICVDTFLKYRTALVDQKLIYVRLLQDHPAYYAKTDSPELWAEIRGMDLKMNGTGGDQVDVERTAPA